MSINYEIYGTPETWHDCYYGGGSTAAWAAVLHGERAKVPTWNTAHPSETPTFEQSQLRYAVDDNKLTPTQPIDISLCAIGQGTASPFRQFAIFRNDATTEQPNGEIRQVGQAYTGANYNDNNIVNSFWFESNSFTYSGNYGNGAFSRGCLQIRDGATITQGINQRTWSPSGVNAHGTNKQNGNFYIAPFVSYGTRTYVLQIWVWVTNADYTADFVPGSGAPAGQWRTLDDWKNNYPTKAITACLLTPRVISTYNSSTGAIGYYRVNFDSAQYRKVASGILDTIKFEFDDGYTLPELTAYGLFSANSNTNIGVALFNEMTLYKWSDTLQNIGVVNSYIASYIRSNGQFMTPYIPYSDYIYEWIMSACACFGMAFTPAKATGADASNCVFNQSFTDANLCLPVITDSGVANGEYTRGADNTNNDFIDLVTPWDKNYTPSAPVDTNTYSITTGFNTVGNVASTTKAYVVNGNALTGLSVEMWNIINNLVTTPDDMTNLDNLTLDAFLTNNPIDAIVSVKKFPLSSVPHAENLENIYLGKYQTSAAGYALALQQARYNFEGIPIFPKFGNCFLDYSPYTKMQLYVPFCGTIDIDAADFMGRTLSVEMVIDFITGAVTAYVLANQLVVTSLTGNCGIDIPITGTEQSTVSAALESAILQDKSARGNYTLKGSVGGMLTNPIGNLTHPSTAIENRFSTKIQTMQANYNLQHVEMPLRQIGSASPLNSWALEFVCRLIIYYPDGECISFNATNEPSLISEKVQAFGAVNGFATVETDTLSSFTGFTQVSGADLSGISATDTEKEMIMSLLQSGVYL